MKPAARAAFESGRTPISITLASGIDIDLNVFSITALPGDTLWSIAQTYRGDVPVSRYVDKLVSLNGGASIQAGQAVVIP